jgi:hypothetical protein
MNFLIGTICEPSVFFPLLLVSDFIFSYFKELISFSMHRETHVVNLARVEPSLLISKPVKSGSKDYPLIHFRNSNTPALCIDFGSLVDDFLKEARSVGAGDFKMRQISARMLSMEFERKVAAECVIHSQTSIRASIVGNRWSYTTKPGKSYRGNSNQSKPDLYTLQLFLLII